MNDPENHSDRGPLSLSPEERRQLAQAFFTEIDGDDAGGEEYDRAWSEELLRRVTEIRDGTAETYSADEVFAEARKMFPDRAAPSAETAAGVPEDVEAAWEEEIRVRMADFMAGRTPATSGDEMLARLRAHRGASGSA